MMEYKLRLLALAQWNASLRRGVLPRASELGWPAEPLRSRFLDTLKVGAGARMVVVLAARESCCGSHVCALFWGRGPSCAASQLLMASQPVNPATPNSWAPLFLSPPKNCSAWRWLASLGATHSCC